MLSRRAPRAFSLIRRFSSTPTPTDDTPNHALSPPVLVRKKGADLMNDPLLNKGTGFTVRERDRLGIRCLVPPASFSMEEQVKRIRHRLSRCRSPIESFLALSGLHDRNETLFYRVLIKYIAELAPVVYTPTVGIVCQKFGAFFRRARGMYVTPNERGELMSILWNWKHDVDVIVVTDGSRILGLGDLGVQGMGISIGKLCLYTAAGGVNPARTLPVVIDVGTDNEKLRDDPFYLGLRQPRLRGHEFHELMHEFLTAVKVRWPHALVQFEDFSNENAYPLLHRYRKQQLCFNDDIQGTGAVALAGVFTALRQRGEALTAIRTQRIVVLGAGSAGLGVAMAIRSGMIGFGLTEEEASANFWMVDVNGLLTAKRSGMVAAQRVFARQDGELPEGASLLDVVRAVQPTVLLGLSGQGGAFDEAVIRSMAEHCQRPIIFPLSNPTANAEISAAACYGYTNGNAIFASGSPFAPVAYDGEQTRVLGEGSEPPAENERVLVPSQGNNVFIFPGVGMGAVLCQATRVSIHMFSTAAKVLSEQVNAEEMAHGMVYPAVDRVREVSQAVAAGVVRCAIEQGLAQREMPKKYTSIEQWVEAESWEPEYRQYVCIDE